MRTSAFLQGFGSVMNITGIPALERSFIRDDAEAIRSDWEAVGADIGMFLPQQQPNTNGHNG